MSSSPNISHITQTVPMVMGNYKLKLAVSILDQSVNVI